MNKRKIRTGLYFALAVGMLIYAVPRMTIGGGWTEETIFSTAWICMALLIIAAQLYHLIGVNDKVEQDIQTLKRYKYWRIQQQIVHKTGRDKGRSSS